MREGPVQLAVLIRGRQFLLAFFRVFGVVAISLAAFVHGDDVSLAVFVILGRSALEFAGLVNRFDLVLAVLEELFKQAILALLVVDGIAKLELTVRVFLLHLLRERERAED